MGLEEASAVGSETILHILTTHQYLHPHAPLVEVLEEMCTQTGCCKVAMQRALEWLRVDPHLSVGRLRRSELSQLARAIDRFWQHRQVHSAASEQ